MNKFFYILLTVLFLTSCKEDVIPKPKAYLSLNYPVKKYQKINIKKPYSFDVEVDTKIVDLPNGWLKIEYPKLKASVDITYRALNDNLKEVLTDAEKLVFEHTVKADQITSNNFNNKEQRVYGSMFDITGNSASQIQFHITDSIKHFLKGSLFFRTKPNYDSILPAVDYIKQDMIHIIETMEWKSSPK